MCHSFLVFGGATFNDLNFKNSDGTLLHAHCVQGKRRVQGVRPPYSWTIPLLHGLCQGFPGLPSSPDWARGLKDLYSDLAPLVQGGTQPFLIPRIRRGSSDCWALGAITCQPMGYRAFTEAFRGLLVQFTLSLSLLTRCVDSWLHLQTSCILILSRHKLYWALAGDSAWFTFG